MENKENFKKALLAPINPSAANDKYPEKLKRDAPSIRAGESYSTILGAYPAQAKIPFMKRRRSGKDFIEFTTVRSNNRKSAVPFSKGVAVKKLNIQ